MRRQPGIEGEVVGIKLFAFGRRREGMTADEFHTYWRDVHARKLADEPTLRRHVRRFELNHRLPEDYARDAYRPEGTGPGWDGVAVLWFDSMADFEAMQAEPAHAAVAEDGRSSGRTSSSSCSPTTPR